jgi:hypothetical protein
MEILFSVFQEAHTIGSGPLLATTLSPIAPLGDPSYLRRFLNSCNDHNAASSLRTGLLHHLHTTVRFSKAEGNAWVDVYIAYRKAISEIIAIEDGSRSDWAAVYEAWKRVAEALIKGYSSGGFGAWTVPCLYNVGRYLRVFAIKADEDAGTKGSVAYSSLQDDITGDTGKNQRLEDAARVINRIFTLCISDRYVGILYMPRTDTVC